VYVRLLQSSETRRYRKTAGGTQISVTQWESLAGEFTKASSGVLWKFRICDGRRQVASAAEAAGELAVDIRG
jgi:hypothetical protein